MISYNKYNWIRFLSANDTSWNDLTNFCNGEEWCYPVEDGLLNRFQLGLGLGAEMISNGDFLSPLYSGTVTSLVANKLIDAGAAFGTEVVGMSAVNKTDDTNALVTARDSGIQLSLDTDIFAVAGGLDLYEISGWIEGAGWKVNRVANPGVAAATAGSATVLTWGIPNFQQGRTYKVVYTVANRTAGTVFSQVGGGSGASTTTNTTVTDYVLAGSSSAEFRFSKDANFDGEITNVSVTLLDDILLGIKDCDTGEITDLILPIAEAPGTSRWVRTGETADVQIGWSEFGLTTDTCHKVCTWDMDQDNLIRNPGFNDNGLFWSVGANNASFNFTGERLNGASTGFPASNIEAVDSTASLVTAGKKYIVRYTIVSITDAEVQPYLGGTALSALGTTPGTYTQIATATSTGQGGVRVDFTSGSGAIILDEVYVIAVEDTDRCSECFQYKTDQPSALTFTWYNNEDAFGFDYESAGPGGILNRAMFWSRVGKENFPQSIEDHLDSAGVKSLLWAQSRETRELIYADMPAYVHRAMAIAWINDNMAVTLTPTEITTYVKEPGDWEPAWQDFRNIAPVIIEIEESDQGDTSNANC